MDWPGAFAVAGGKTFVNVYVGDGLPYSATTYTPPLPLGISQEFGAVVEEGYESRINALGRCTKLPEPEDAGDDYEPPEGDDVAGPLGGVGEEEGKDNWSFRAAEGGAGQTGGELRQGS